MKRRYWRILPLVHLLYGIVVLPSVLFAFNGDLKPSKDPALEGKVKGWMNAGSGIRFLENKGQLADLNGKPVADLLFKVSEPGVDVYIADWGLSYVFTKASKPFPNQHPGATMDFQAVDTFSLQYERADMELVGATIRKENIVKELESEDRTDYYFSYCPAGIVNVHGYQKISIKNVYPGIDWVLYSKPGKDGKGIKYDFVVHPGADPSLIRLKYKWTDRPVLQSDGSVKISMPFGELMEGAPVCYQPAAHEDAATTAVAAQSSGMERNIETHYRINGNELGFEIGTYNSRETLIIDPTLVWGTYYNAPNGVQFTLGVSTDGVNVWVTGDTQGQNGFPTFSLGAGAYMQGFAVTQGYGANAFVLEFNTCGKLIWATYYGGSTSFNGTTSAWDYGSSISSDGTNVWVTGNTRSSDFPVLSKAGAFFQGTNNTTFLNPGGGFILEFNCATNARVWASYYGGSNYDRFNSISSDGTNVWVCGSTISNDFPTQFLAGAYNQGGLNYGAGNAFIIQLNCGTSARTWATYFGSYNYNAANSINSDGTNVWVTGYAGSQLPLVNPGHGAYYQAANGGSNTNAFVAQFSCSSSSNLWSTYYGGSGGSSQGDMGNSIYSDGTNVWVTGGTFSTDFPVLDAGGGDYFQGTSGGIYGNIFILKFNCATNARLWATYYGGSGNSTYREDIGYSITSDGNSVWVTGGTDSPDFPTMNSSCSNFFQNTLGGSPLDVFVLQFNTSCVRKYATYFGTALDGNGGGWISSHGPDNVFLAAAGNTGFPTVNPGGGAFYNSTVVSPNVIMAKFNTCLVITLPQVSTDTSVCLGGSVPLKVSGGAAVSYSWLPVAGLSSASIPNPIATPTVSTTYTVTGTDECGITSTTTVTVTVNPSPVLNTPTVTNTSCGSSNGGAIANASGGTGTLTYNWNNSITGPTNANLGAGTYTLTVSDVNGCSATQSVLVNSSPGPTINSLSPTAILCRGASTGSALVSATGSGTLTYTWSDGSTSLTGQGTTEISDLSSGTYSVTVTDGSGCISISTVSVTQPLTAVSVNSVLAQNGLCGAPGSAQAVASGGTGTLNYSWSNGSTSFSGSSVSGLSSGTYTLTVSDGNSCTNTSIAVISTISGPTATVTPGTAILCRGASTGSVTVSITGGAAAYTFNWSNGSSSFNGLVSGSAFQITDADAGTYTVTITDANGCSSASSVTLTQPATSVDITNLQSTTSTCGSSNGTATVSASGGSGTLTYSWSASGGSGQSTSSLSGLAVGNYTVTVTDANGCSVTGNTSVANVGSPSINSTDVINPLCSTGSGQASVSAVGGSGTLTYSWGNGSVSFSGQSVSGLSTGTYSVTVTDKNGCESVSTVSVSIPSAVTATASQLIAADCNKSDGAAVATANGGNGSSYTYSWSNLTSGAGNSNLLAGTYTVTVTDANGCTATSTTTINNSDGLTVKVLDSVSTCLGTSAGAVSISATGTGDSYTWSDGASAMINGQGTASISALTAGIYTVTVTDLNGCTATTAATVIQFPEVVVNVSSDTTIDKGGAAQLRAGGGVSYSWTPSGTLSSSAGNNPFAYPLQTTTYTVLVTDANGCSAKDSIKISVIEPVDCDSVSIFMPTAFSPNGDGMNDVLFVRGLPGCVNQIQLSIFDRWGEQVFGTTSISNGWDGTFEGKALNMGVFAYYLSATFANGNTYSRKGNVTLLR